MLGLGYPHVAPAGQLIKKSWGEFKKLWKKLVLLLLATYAVIAVILIVMTVVIALLSSSEGLGKDVISWMGPLVFTAAIITATVFSFIGQLHLIKDKKVAVSVWKRFWEARREFVRFIAVMALIVLISAIGFILFVVPGIIASLYLSFAYYELILGNEKTVKGSIKASYNLVRGYWFTVFARLFVWILLMYALLIPSIIPILGSVWVIVLSFVMTPLTLIFTYELWQSLHTAKRVHARDGMPKGKKAGLVVVIALPLIIIPVLIGLLTAVFVSQVKEGNIKFDVEVPADIELKTDDESVTKDEAIDEFERAVEKKFEEKGVQFDLEIKEPQESGE